MHVGAQRVRAALQQLAGLHGGLQRFEHLRGLLGALGLAFDACRRVSHALKALHQCDVAACAYQRGNGGLRRRFGPGGQVVAEGLALVAVVDRPVVQVLQRGRYLFALIFCPCVFQDGGE